ncbi:MAG: sensor histidine kinase [Chloroflexi bacterium]|nr:sensor histidine kinase [Chloroflexota bacterium]MDL1884172.1 HAMP domain-containing histidine kinase [Anaerolineae bacterium CFX8]
MFSLRGRLLASYALLLGFTLAVIAVALLLFLYAQPPNPAATYEKLASIARELTGELNITNLSAEGRPLARALVSGLLSQLNSFAADNDVRILAVNVPNQTVLFDSTGTLQRGDSIPLNQQTYALPLYLRRVFPVQAEPIFGSFRDVNGVWIFTGLLVVRQDTERSALLLAEPQPAQSWETVLARFRDNLALPLLQAAGLGLVVAALLAALISRNIARPLQRLGRAAAAVAAGDYTERVSVSGPQEVRAVAEAFNQMADQVHITQQAQQDFLANVSHDLKTPLTSIQGYSQAIMDGTAKDSKLAAGIIYDEAARLNRMVIELTDLARLQAGRLSMQAQPVDLGALATAVGQRLAVVAQKKGVTLHIEAPPMPEIAGDGDRLAQVLTNLLSNAVNYTPSGRQVWLKTRVNHGGVEVIVQDTGIGIPPEDLPHIFERFYQVDKTRGPKRGTGLGLAITQEIVAAHGGRIQVDSPGIGQGAIFIVWLPSPQINTIVRRRRQLTRKDTNDS